MARPRSTRTSRHLARLALSLVLLLTLLVPLGTRAQAPDTNAAPSLDGASYEACLFAGTLSQVSETADPLNPSLTCGRGEVITLQGGDDLFACLHAGSLTQTAASQPTCSRGEVVGLSSANSDYYACLYGGRLSQVGTSQPGTCGRGTHVELQDAFNRAPVAVDDVISATGGTPTTVPAPGVLANDTDPDGDALTSLLESGPSHGTLLLNADGSFTYTPNSSYSGIDTFTYVASDGRALSNAATVTINVTRGNTPPVANDDSYTAVIDSPLTIPAPGVLTNDHDVDGDVITAELTAHPTNGTLVFNDDGSFTYTPNAGFSGTDSFWYVVFDGFEFSDSAQVTIQVQAP